MSYIKISIHDEMDFKYLAVRHREENEITCTVSEIKQSIADLKKLLDANDVGTVFAYKSLGILNSKDCLWNSRLPYLDLNLEKSTQDRFINSFDLYQRFLFKQKKKSFKMDSLDAESSPPKRPFVDIPQIITVIETKHKDYDSLFRVSCLSVEEIWTFGNDNMTTLYNLQVQGESVKSVEIKSGKSPKDIEVTRSGDLV